MNNNYNKLNSEKKLPDVFKELKEAQKMYAIQEINDKKKTKSKHSKRKNVQVNTRNNLKDFNTYSPENNYNNCTSIKNHRFNAIGAAIGVLFLALFMTTIKSNYIFATSKEEEKKVIGTFEENENPINLMSIASENISEVVKKEIVTEKYVIDKEIEYIDNTQLPKDEEVVIEEGNDGNREVTYIRSYENDELIDEKIINEVITVEPSKSVIQKGTSEYLANKKAHIGDTMYTVNETNMMMEADENSTQNCKVYQYIDVKLDEVTNGWCKITVDGLQGYVKEDTLTSAAITPDIVEKSRIQRIMISVNYNMELNKPSGLTRTDFTKVLSGNVQDVNKIFENNAGLFYDIEQKYNVNGIFLAAIGIHESAWGTSTIAKDKKNLFGYGAYDSSPYSSSVTFESYEYGIELLAKVLSKYYLNEQGTSIYDGETAVASFYNGPTVSGVNTRYASDPNWADKVFSTMESLYKKLQ